MSTFTPPLTNWPTMTLMTLTLTDQKYKKRETSLKKISGSECNRDKCVDSCGHDWEQNGDHCYFWSTDKKNWIDAEDFCQNEGGHLASVTTNATKQYVDEGLTNRTGLGDVYLGGNDIEEEGVWKWTDCTPWDVEFWNPGEPNNGGGIRDCLQHYQLQKTWDDDHCFNDKSFLCSKRICSGKQRQRRNVKKHHLFDFFAIFTILML